MYKSSLRHIHDPVLLSWKVEVICFVLSCFPPSLPLFRIPRPRTCIGSESRLSLQEGSTAQAAMTSLCYDSREFHWNKHRLRHTHVKTEVQVVKYVVLCHLVSGCHRVEGMKWLCIQVPSGPRRTIPDSVVVGCVVRVCWTFLWQCCWVSVNTV